MHDIHTRFNKIAPKDTHTLTHKGVLCVFSFIPVSCILRMIHTSSGSSVSISASATFFSHSVGLVVSKSILLFVV
jgi:hypothetical protein